LTHCRFSHGGSEPAGQRAGLATNVARGYVTIDAVSNCTLRFPSDIGYFAAGGTGDAINQNVLWGDYIYSNPAADQSSGETLVHIEASAASPETSVAGQYTFYGRYVGWTAADNREPLRPTSPRASRTSRPAATAHPAAAARSCRLARLEGQSGPIQMWHDPGLVPPGAGTGRDFRRAGAPAGSRDLPGISGAAEQRNPAVPAEAQSTPWEGLPSRCPSSPVGCS